MRILGKTDNEIYINDKVSGDVLEIKYRRPTTEEIVEYHAGLYENKNGEVKINHRARIQGALAVITGIGEKCFADVDGKAIHSDKGHEDYAENWKELLEKHASDILFLVALQVFESTKIIDKGELPLLKK